MKRQILRHLAGIACLSLGIAGVRVAPVAAQTANSGAASSGQVRLNVSGATVSTTKMLAIGRWTPKATVAGVRPILPAEVRDTVRLYLDGVIDQWFVQQDNSGVVFLLNVTEIDKARERLEKLPLGQAGLMEFELTPLGPISPLGSLIAASPK